METQNINKINKIISILLFAQVVHLLYLVIPSILMNFSSDMANIIIYFIFLLNIIFLILSGIGILLRKKWSIVIYWIFVILPIILPFVQSHRGYYGYLLIVLNVISVVILTSYNWKAWSK